MSPAMNPTDWERIGRYLAGESSPEEAAAVRRWLEEHRSDAQMIATLDTATQGLGPSEPVDVEAALARVKTRMRAPAPAAGARSFTWRQYGTFAAAAAVILAVGLVVA